MTTNTQLERLEKDYNAVAKLHYSLMQSDLDKEYIQNGGKITYAIDTSILNKTFSTESRSSKVVTFFVGPTAKEAVREDDQIFDVLVNYILHTLPCLQDDAEPFLILLPGHADEARYRLMKILSETSSVSSKDYEDELLSHFSALDNLPSEKSRFQYLKTNEDRLHHLIYRFDHPHQVFRDFASLLSEKVFSLRRAATSTKYAAFTNDRGSFLSRVNSTLAAGGKEGSALWWQNNLHSKLPQFMLDQDKKALSTLDAINRVTEREGRRTVLITDNDDLVDAAQLYSPHRHIDEELKNFTFCDLYVRHPRSFVGDADLLTPDGGARSETRRNRIREWLSILLTEIGTFSISRITEFRNAISSDQAPSYRRSRLSAALDRDPEIHRRLVKRWRAHKKNIEIMHVSTSKQAQSSLEHIIGQSGLEGLSYLGALKSYIQKTTEQTWNDLFVTSARAGYEFIGIEERHIRLPKRRTPYLLLRSHKFGSKFVDAIQSGSPISVIEPTILSILGEMEKSKNLADEYVTALCFAQLFSLAERWEDANVVCSRAIDISKLNPDAYIESAFSDDHWISGREAYYLRSVLCRLTAKTREDLGAAKNSLDDALDALKRENKLRGTEPGGSPLTGIRLEAERVAIGLAMFLFSISNDDWKPGTTTKRKKDISLIFTNAQKLLSAAALCDHPEAREATEVNLRTNIFSCLFLNDVLDLDLDLTSFEVRPFVEDQIEYSKSRMSIDDKLQVSDVDLHYLLYAITQTDVADRFVEELLRAYTSRLELKSSEHSGPMPYDKLRFEKLRSKIDNAHFSSF